MVDECTHGSYWADADEVAHCLTCGHTWSLEGDLDE
jgi:hypothetical protein